MKNQISIYDDKKFLTVQEAFKLCNINKLREKYKKYIPYTWTPEEQHNNLERATIFWLNIQKMKLPPSKEDTIVLVRQRYDEGGIYFDSYSIHVEELKTYRCRRYKYSELSKFDLNKLRKISFPNSPIKYAYEYCDTKRILNFLVPVSNIQRYGLETSMAAILNELTFFGIDLDEVEEEKERVINNAENTYNKVTNSSNAIEETTDEVEDHKKLIEEIKKAMDSILNSSEKEDDFDKEKYEKEMVIEGIMSFYTFIDIYNQTCRDWILYKNIN